MALRVTIFPITICEDRYFLWSDTTTNSAYSQLAHTTITGIGGSEAIPYIDWNHYLHNLVFALRK